MSRVQLAPNFFIEINSLRDQVAALTRVLNTIALRDVNTSGRTSAQIDAVVFSSQQPFDGVQATDKTNGLLLVRESGKWAYAAMTVIP